MDSKLKELGRSLTLQRAAASGRQVAGLKEGPVSADELAQTVPGLEVTKEGVEVHHAFNLKPPTLTAPDQIVVTRVWTSKANYERALDAADLMDKAKIAPGLVIPGLQNAIHKDTRVEEPITITPDQVGTKEAKALMIPDFDPNPIETFGTGPDLSYIYFTQKVFSKPETQASELGEGLKELGDSSKLPATLSGEDNPEGYQGTQIVIIQAQPEIMAIKSSPEAMEGNTALTPAITGNPSIGQSSNSGPLNNEPVVGGDKGMFIPKKASYVWAPESQSYVEKNNQQTSPAYNVLDEAAAVVSEAEIKNPLPAAPVSSGAFSGFITPKAKPEDIVLMPGSLVTAGDKKSDNNT